MHGKQRLEPIHHVDSESATLYLTGQVPRQRDQPMTSGTIEEQTGVALEAIKATLAEAGCELSDVVKATV